MENDLYIINSFFVGSQCSKLLKKASRHRQACLAALFSGLEIPAAVNICIVIFNNIRAAKGISSAALIEAY
jgi:hypothetical protein